MRNPDQRTGFAGIDLQTLATQLGYDDPFGGPDWHNLWAKMAIEEGVDTFNSVGQCVGDRSV